MSLRKLSVAALCCVVWAGAAPAGVASARQQQQPAARAQGEGTPSQRLSIMRSRIEGLRRSLNGAVATLNAGEEKKDKDK